MVNYLSWEIFMSLETERKDAIERELSAIWETDTIPFRGEIIELKSVVEEKSLLNLVTLEDGRPVIHADNIRNLKVKCPLPERENFKFNLRRSVIKPIIEIALRNNAESDGYDQLRKEYHLDNDTIKDNSIIVKQGLNGGLNDYRGLVGKDDGVLGHLPISRKTKKPSDPAKNPPEPKSGGDFTCWNRKPPKEGPRPLMDRIIEKRAEERIKVGRTFGG
jgi:hypothetical protein